MYAVETAKMSSKGQLVVPEAFRKRYGWRAGSTLLMLGASGGVLLQTLPVPDEREVEKTIAETRIAAASVKTRVVSWKEAAARKDSAAKDALVMPCKQRRKLGSEAHLRPPFKNSA